MTEDEAAASRPPPADRRATRTATAGERLLEPGTLFAGRYRILELSGVGGMGVVYRARDEELGVEVALKLLRPEIAPHPELRERFRKELLLARQVSHRNVVRIHDLGQEGELQFLTMDFVAGRSLRDILEQEGPLPEARAVAVLRQLAEGLAAAHDEGVVHRDLKPGNILIDESGRAYISDFGVARSMAQAGMTQAGVVVGTPDYLSPEQARGEEVDARSDLYSLGIVLFEMLSGELPFRGGSYAEMLAQRISGAPRGLSEVGVEAPPYLRAALARLLERSPQRRYASARQLVADLDARRAPVAPRRWLGAAAAAALVGLAVLGFYVASRRGAPPAGNAVPAPATAATPVHAVAVVPLADQTSRPDLAWLSVGVADMLTTALAESPSLRVVDGLRLRRTLADLGWRAGGLEPAEAQRLANLLDVDRLVSGVVRASGGTVRLELSLTSAGAPLAAGAPLRADTTESGLFAAVADLGGSLRRELEVEEPPAAAAPATRSPQAMAAYTEGLDKLLGGETMAAAPALERAVAADPEFAAAWLRLSGAYQALGYGDRARDAAARAVAGAGPAHSRLAHEARAQEALARGEPERATAILSELVAAFPNDIEARLALGEAYGREGRLEEAIAALTEVVRRDPNHPRGWFLLGKHTILAGDPKRALDDQLVHALVVQNRLGNVQGKADVWNAMGVAQQRLGDLEKAAASYREAAELRQSIGDRRGYATSLKNLATLALVRGEFDAAERDFGLALGELEAIGDRAGIAELYNAFGALEEGRGRYDRALEAYRRALAIRRELGERLALAQSLSNVGYAYHLLGEYDNAAVYWQQALDLYQAAGDRPGMVAVRQSLAQLALVRGKWDEAARTFLDTLQVSRELGAKEFEAVALGYLGRCAHYQGRYAAAFENWREALARVRELGDARGEVEFALFEAEALGELGMVAEAEQALAAVEEKLAEAGNDEQRSMLASLRGDWALRRGERSRAGAAFTAALERATASRSVTAALRARLGRARTMAGSPGRQALEAVEREARERGDAWVMLHVAEALAGAELGRGQPAAAEAKAIAALRLAREAGGYAGVYRLELLRARALEARGDEAGAGAARKAAAAELERLRAGLDSRQVGSLDQLAEVRELARDTLAPAR